MKTLNFNESKNNLRNNIISNASTSTGSRSHFKNFIKELKACALIMFLCVLIAIKLLFKLLQPRSTWENLRFQKKC